MSTKMKVPASEVVSGDSLPGLDNGYVFEDPETNEAGYFSYPGRSTYSVAMPTDTILISFHDQQGEECYLLVPGEFEIEVSRD